MKALYRMVHTYSFISFWPVAQRTPHLYLNVYLKSIVKKSPEVFSCPLLRSGKYPITLYCTLRFEILFVSFHKSSGLDLIVLGFVQLEKKGYAKPFPSQGLGFYILVRRTFSSQGRISETKLELRSRSCFRICALDVYCVRIGRVQFCACID